MSMSMSHVDAQSVLLPQQEYSFVVALKWYDQIVKHSIGAQQ